MHSKFLCSLLLLSSVAFAQTVPSVKTNTPLMSPPPGLDELSGVKLELQQTKIALAQCQANAIMANGQKANSDMQQTVMEIEKKYPGYTITQQRDGGWMLVQKPESPVTPVTPTKEQPKTTPKK